MSKTTNGLSSKDFSTHFGHLTLEDLDCAVDGADVLDDPGVARFRCRELAVDKVLVTTSFGKVLRSTREVVKA